MSDPYFSNVVLLMHGESLKDEISGSFATTGGVTPASIDNTNYKFGTGAIKLEAGQLYFPDSDNWDFGTGPFTIEFWVRPNLSTGQRAFMAQYSFYASNNPTWMIRTGSGKLYFSYFDGTTHNSVQNSKTFTNNVWYALCVERDASNNLRIYVNGLQLSKTTGFNYNLAGNNNPLIIGSLRPDLESFDTFCNYDEIRITKGVARYASDSGYTLQTAPFPDSGAASHSGGVSNTLGAVASSGDGFVYHVHYGALSKELSPITTDATGLALAVDIGELSASLGGVALSAEGDVTQTTFGSGSGMLGGLTACSVAKHGGPVRVSPAALFLGA